MGCRSCPCLPAGQPPRCPPSPANCPCPCPCAGGRERVGEDPGHLHPGGRQLPYLGHSCHAGSQRITQPGSAGDPRSAEAPCCRCYSSARAVGRAVPARLPRPPPAAGAALPPPSLSVLPTGHVQGLHPVSREDQGPPAGQRVGAEPQGGGDAEVGRGAAARGARGVPWRGLGPQAGLLATCRNVAAGSGSLQCRRGQRRCTASTTLRASCACPLPARARAGA